MGYKDGELRNLLEEIKDRRVIFCGDGAIAYKEIIEEIMGENATVISKGNSIPRSVLAAQLSVEMPEENLYTLEPFYVNKSQAEREKEERLARKDI